MDADELEQWLGSAESRRVGWKGRDGKASESVGHAAGRRIVAILRSGVRENEDYALMRKAVGVIARHRAQRPTNFVTSRWRYSLMNWGYDPLKDDL
jgi:hypothetical protein